MTNTRHIIIISDTICPWCYIGLKRLQRALDLFRKTVPGARDITFDIEWKPYFLDRSIQGAGISMDERMRTRLNDDERYRKAKNSLTSTMMAEGIVTDWTGACGNSMLSHQLLHLAYSSGGSKMQTSVAERLFALQFELAQGISDGAVLVEIAVQEGMLADDVERWLGSPEAEAVVNQEESEVRSIAGKGVPRFVVNGSITLDGAIDVSEWLEVLLQTM